jgi:hypothetical protein
MDADFCAQFIKVLHLQGTPGFHTLAVYDKVCCSLALRWQILTFPIVIERPR